MNVQKGKTATKGQKQIYEENKSTLRFYTVMSSAAMIAYVFVMFSLFSQHMTEWKYWLLILFSGSVYFTSLSLMKYMAKPVHSTTGALLDGGTDLNMEKGFGEHLKDLIILTTGVQFLSLTSNYFWLLWLLAPARAFYMLWVNILGPWFFQPAPEQNEQQNEKKQKKFERKMKRI